MVCPSECIQALVDINPGSVSVVDPQGRIPFVAARQFQCSNSIVNFLRVRFYHSPHPTTSPDLVCTVRLVGVQEQSRSLVWASAVGGDAGHSGRGAGIPHNMDHPPIRWPVITSDCGTMRSLGIKWP